METALFDRLPENAGIWAMALFAAVYYRKEIRLLLSSVLKPGENPTSKDAHYWAQNIEHFEQLRRDMEKMISLTKELVIILRSIKEELIRGNSK